MPKEIIEAAKEGNLKKIKELVRSGVSIDEVDEHGTTVLMAAAQQGRLYVMRYALFNKSEESRRTTLNLWDIYGRTALYQAAFYKQWYAFDWLVKNEACFYASNQLNDTTIMVVIRGSTLERVKFCIEEAGACPHSHDVNGATPLMAAVEAGKEDIAIYLIDEQKVNINEKDNFSETALMKAAELGNLTLTNLLIERKADHLIRNANKETALMIAERKGHKTVADFLKALDKAKKVAKTLNTIKEPRTSRFFNPVERDPSELFLNYFKDGHITAPSGLGPQTPIITITKRGLHTPVFLLDLEEKLAKERTEKKEMEVEKMPFCTAQRCFLFSAQKPLKPFKPMERGFNFSSQFPPKVTTPKKSFHTSLHSPGLLKPGSMAPLRAIQSLKKLFRR